MSLYARRPSAKSLSQCRNGVILFSVLWVLGLVCGLYFVSSADSTFVDSLFSASFVRPSFIGISGVVFLPIAITALAVYFSSAFIIYLFSFIKAFCYSIVLCGVVAVFGYSGWLIGLLFLFSESCTSVLILWLWHRVLACNCVKVGSDLLICAAISAVIGLIDYFLVSPYLVMLLNY